MWWGVVKGPVYKRTRNRMSCLESCQVASPRLHIGTWRLGTSLRSELSKVLRNVIFCY